MLLKTTNGTIMEVARVEPIVESRERFNATVHRRVAVAKDMNQNISGILFTMKRDEFNVDVFQPDNSKLLIGNLKREVVEELMDSLLSKGYADVSGYSYQSGNDITKFTYDNGKSSKPYYINGYAATIGLETLAMNNPMTFSAPMFPFQSGWECLEEEGDDCEDFETLNDAEQMRKEIYSMSDSYTITQLANMGEEELSDILRGIESRF